MTRALALLLLLPLSARAETHAVTIRNGADETIRSVGMAPAGQGKVGPNRMQSQLPPGAAARITYSTGCRADIRLGYASGRTEDHLDVDVCSEPRITAGQDGVAGLDSPPSATRASISTAPVSASRRSAPAIAKPSLPAVPPWTGKSITKRFGGLD